MNPAGLRALVGSQVVLTDPDQRAGYEVDWTRRYVGRCDAVVRPQTVAQVQDVVRWCASEGVHVVPQGGNSGLVGGGVPDGGPTPRIVLSMRAIDRIRDVDTVAGTALVDAGVTLQALEERLRGTGWEFGVDLSARGSATIGGMVATNAGGTRVLRDGTMRSNVLGLEAVLADGSLVSHLGGLLKDNTGYDWPALLCGSEGTLAVVTGVLLRLVPERPDRVCVAVNCSSWDEAVALAHRARRTVPGIEVIEAIDQRGANLVREVLGVAPPFPAAPITLWLVWAGQGDAPAELVEVVADRTHAVGPPSALFAARDRQSEAIAATGIPHKFDITVPLRHLPAFVQHVESEIGLKHGDAVLYVFGHVGDGNLHVNVVGPEPSDERVDATVLEAVARWGGSISAEHGIGRAKAPWLGLSRSPGEIRLMRALKDALDPLGILNPGVLLAPVHP